MSRWVKTISFSKDGVRVIFEPTNAVGFSHRVIVVVGEVAVAKDWLSTRFRVSAKTAEFFATKHAATAGKAS